jgi:hypothetical protein
MRPYLCEGSCSYCFGPFPSAPASRVFWVTDGPVPLDGDQWLVGIFSLAKIVVKCAAAFAS